MWDIAINSSLALLRDGFLTLLKNWTLLALLLTGQVTFGALTIWLLEGTVKNRDTLATLSFLGGILGLTVYCLALAWFKIKPTFTSLIPLVFICIGIIGLQWKRVKIAPSLNLVFLVLFFFFILSLRMIFILDLLVPPYADSIQHVAIVRDMLSPGQPAQAFYQISFNLDRYYHFGFHAMAAWLSGISAIDPIQVILFLGQYFQALAILGLYPLARIVLKDTLAAWIAMGVGLFFLPLPAYASNWGKYPAIASLAGINLVFSLLFIYLENCNTGKTLPKRFYWWVGIASLATFFLHSRTLILFTIAFSLGLLTHHKVIRGATIACFGKSENKSEIKIILTFVISLLMATVIMVLDLPFHPLFGVFLFGVLLISFYGDFFLTLFFSVLALLASAFALAQTATNQPFSLLDRPYVAIFLYIPISFFVALAFNKLISQKSQFNWNRLGFSVIFLAGIINGLVLQDHRPSSCCIFVNDDDLFTFEWIRQNIPVDTLIGVAATGQPGNFLPADGGAWIESMTGIPTRKLDFRTDFSLKSERLCQNGLKYIYADASDNSFDSYALIESGAQHLLGFGTVSVYQLNCK